MSSLDNPGAAGDYITNSTNSLEGFGAISFVGWVRADTPGADNEIMLAQGNFQDGPGEFFMHGATDKYRVTIPNGTGSWEAYGSDDTFTTLGVGAGEWHHLAATWTNGGGGGATFKIVLDGVSLGISYLSGSGGNSITDSTTALMTVGRRSIAAEKEADIGVNNYQGFSEDLSVAKIQDLMWNPWSHPNNMEHHWPGYYNSTTLNKDHVTNTGLTFNGNATVSSDGAPYHWPMLGV